MEKLKPCPFCGGEAEINRIVNTFYQYASYFSSCTRCSAESKTFETEKEAIKAWNTRAERTCHNMSDFQDCDCFICSECGEAFETARLEYDDDLFYSLNDAVHEDYYDRCDCDLNYCPNCGAKVVE